MLTGSLTYLRDKYGRYNTNFVLYPKSQRLPLFSMKPVDMFRQYKWLSDYGSIFDYEFKVIQQLTDAVGMIEGTPFEINLRAYDPTNLFNITDDRNITYTWKRDGAPLYQFNSQNDLRGTSLLKITSESCTRDVSGVYELEATNKFGTTTSTPITIDVVNRKYHPYLYKNLLINGCGEQGLGEWTTDSDISVKTFSQYNRNQSSIPAQVYHVNNFGPYSEEFAFSSYGNETNLASWFQRVKNPDEFDPSKTWSAGYNKWIIKNYHPNLVPTDGLDTGPQSSFFPSWNYIDSYNKNTNLYKLGNIIQNSSTYITRDKIKFAIYGGKAKSQAYQDISVSEIASMIDGKYYGIDKLVAHFFAYVGIGISSYKLEFIDANTGALADENPIPITSYAYKVASLNGKPSFIPSHPETSQYQYAASSIDFTARNKYARKIKQNTRINLTPVCYDKTDIRLDFLNENGLVIGAETIQGPTEKDIWAVKEKFFLPYYAANLYGWVTNATDQVFCYYSQSYTTMDAILGVDNPSAPVKDVNAEFIKKYHYPLFNGSVWEFSRPNSNKQSITAKKEDEPYRRQAIETYGFNRSFIEQYGPVAIPLWYVDGVGSKYDKGAAAFFGIQKNVTIPRGTRTIRVNILFSHTSEALYDSNPRLKDWRNQEIYYDFFTKDQPSVRLVNYGNPRCGVTAAHLSIHPNVVEVSEDYNTYEINLSGSVWYQELLKLNNPDQFNSIRSQSFDVDSLQYIASITTLPPVPNINPSNYPPTYDDLPTITGQNNAGALEEGTGAPIQAAEEIPTEIEPDSEPITPLPEDVEEPTTGSAATSSE